MCEIPILGLGLRVRVEGSDLLIFESEWCLRAVHAYMRANTHTHTHNQPTAHPIIVLRLARSCSPCNATGGACAEEARGVVKSVGLGRKQDTVSPNPKPSTMNPKLNAEKVTYHTDARPSAVLALAADAVVLA